MTLPAAHPTVVIGLGDAVGAVHALARDLDDGFDLEEERGLRYLVEQGGPQRFGYVCCVSRDEIVRHAREALADLAGSGPASVVPAKRGLRVVVVASDSDLPRATTTVVALRADPRMAELHSAYELGGGLQLRLVIATTRVQETANQWMQAQAAEPTLAPVSTIIIGATRDGVHLDRRQHLAAVTTALRTLVLEATHELERCDPATRLLGLSDGRCRIWQVGELVDGSVTLADERRRQQFAEWLTGFVHRPRDPAAVVPKLPSLAIALATRTDQPRHPVMARLEQAIEALQEKGNMASSAVARAQADPDLAGQPTWPEQTCEQLRLRLDRTLLHGGREQSEAWLHDVSDALNADTRWHEQLHGSLGLCGTEPVVATLQDQLRRSQAARDVATLEAPTTTGPGLSDLTGKLSGLQRTLIDTIGGRPPLRWRHWMMLPWLAFGMLSTPIWQALGRQFGPPNSVFHSPLELVAHAITWYVGAQEQALAFGAALGLAGWSLVWWLARRRWQREVAEWCADVRRTVEAAAVNPGGRLSREIGDLCHRVKLARFDALESGIQRLRLRIARIRRTTETASWLIRRMEGRRFVLPHGDHWQVQEETPRVRWRLLPPAGEVGDGYPVGRTSASVSSHSPWRSVDFKPSDSLKAKDFFIFPRRALACWEKLNASDDSLGPVPGNQQPAELLKSCSPGRLEWHHLSEGASSLVVVLASDPITNRLQNMTGKDASQVLGLLCPPNPTHSSVEPSRQHDRIIVVQQVSLKLATGGLS